MEGVGKWGVGGAQGVIRTKVERAASASLRSVRGWRGGGKGCGGGRVVKA